MSSLEGYGSTVELHPHVKMPNVEIQMTNVCAIRRPFSHFIRHLNFVIRHFLVGGEGFEPSKDMSIRFTV